jgi:hypothetical protein
MAISSPCARGGHQFEITPNYPAADLLRCLRQSPNEESVQICTASSCVVPGRFENQLFEVFENHTQYP